MPFPREFVYNLNARQTAKNYVSYRKKDRYNINILKTSIFTFEIKMTLSQRYFRKLKADLVVNLIKINDNVLTTIKNYNLNTNNLSVSDEITLDAGTYVLYVSYSANGINVTYELNYDLTQIVYVNSNDISQTTEQIQTTTVVVEPKKYALIVGISDYLYINDLEYCDEDAVSWCDFLSSKNYEFTVLGDKTSSYGKYTKNDLATEANIKKYMNDISIKANSGDQFVFISSGHGSGDGKGNSFLCCLDEQGVAQGEYTDKELAVDIKKFTDKQVKAICFFDNCFSGGMIPEVVGDDPKLVCATSTCTQDGYGYDVTTYKHGAWTYAFLIQTLMKYPNLNVNDIFAKALLTYPYKGGDLPQLGGNGSLYF